MSAKQLTLPKVGPRFRGYDHSPRAHLYRTMELLGQCEDRALAAYEDEDNEEWEEAEQELDRCVEQAQRFYQMAIGPVVKGWWLA